jgi:hypothetical protein
MSATLEGRIEAMIAKYDAAVAAALRDARRRLRAQFERGYELVFDNYNALVFGISPSDKSRDAFVSIAGYPKWVTLFFLHGATLPDPHGLLVGTGKQVRSIRLDDPAQMDTPAVRALIAAAAKAQRAALAAAPPLDTVLKMALENTRPRRPAARKAATKATKARPKRSA